MIIMCAICGWITSNKESDLASGLQGMCRTMQHRGPDDQGIKVFDGLDASKYRLGFGHNRLSIIDLSEMGHQPMTNEDGSVWIVFNGEIYNFKDLRELLISKGHVFRSQTDTEVIIHLYEEEGEDCLLKLNGMFAFAIWDIKKQRLFLARDRLGEKPLYFYSKDGQFLFASEMKAFRSIPHLNMEIDHQALDDYLRFNYIPADRSIFKSVKKLEAAHRLIWERGEFRTERYWELSYEPKVTEPVGVIGESLVEKLERSVKMRLVADVPVGAFLSGGIDSSTIVALMRRVHSGPVKTFSVGFGDGPAWFDELDPAKLVAEHLETDHHEIVVTPQMFIDMAEKMSFQLDEPMGDYASLPTYYVAKLAREHVTVVLTGEGSDELFAGYPHYVRYFDDERARIFQSGLRSPFLSRLLTKTARAWPFDSHRFMRSLNRISQDGLKGSYPGIYCVFDKTFRKQLYLEGGLPAASSSMGQKCVDRYLKSSEISSIIDRMLLVDTKLYLAEDLLMKVDKSTMINSLEARVPFLDHTLVEWAAKLPASLKLRREVTKFILKKAVRSILPRKIIERQKHGFEAPLGFWMRNQLKEVFDGILMSDHAWIFSFLKKEIIRKMWEKHLTGQCDYTLQLWCLFSLESWHRSWGNKSC